MAPDLLVYRVLIYLAAYLLATIEGYYLVSAIYGRRGALFGCTMMVWTDGDDPLHQAAGLRERLHPHR